MPWSMTSAMSSGGVSSIVALIASTMDSIDGSIASRICALVELGDAGRNADDHTRTRIQERALAVHLADEVVEHLLGDVEVADDAVFERTHGDDARWRASHHALRLGADREDRTGPLILRDDRRLGNDDPAPAHVHEGVGGAEVDTDVPREQAEETVEHPWGHPFHARSHVHAKDNGEARQNARGLRVWVSESRLPAAQPSRSARLAVSKRSLSRSRR